MTRVWVVDDELPYDKLTPVQARVEKAGLEYMLNTEPTWSENPAVRNLCQQLVGDANVELTALSAPAVLSKYLEAGLIPPQIVIFDWEGPGFDPQLNVATIERTLQSTFSYLQVYTHLGVDTVEPYLAPIRQSYQGRLLPARSKQDVNPAELFATVKSEYRRRLLAR